MPNFLHDVNHAWRNLWRTPGFTLTALLILALGIGANTAMFGVFYNIVKRPLPFPDEGRLVRIRQAVPMPGAGERRFNISGANMAHLRAHEQQALHSMVALQIGRGVLFGEEARRITYINVGPGWTQTLGVQPMVGRLFGAHGDGQEDAAVISYSLWQSHFGGRQDILGQKLQMEDQTYTVAGVFPRGFNFPYEADVWVSGDESRFSGAAVFGRLKDGVTVEAAMASLQPAAHTIERTLEPGMRGLTIHLQTARESLVENEDEIANALLAVVVAFLLLACVNVANLLLGRVVARRKDLAIRLALGATRRRIFQMLIAESLVLTLLGAGAGVLLAAWSGAFLQPLLPSNFHEELGLGVASFAVEGMIFATTVSVAMALLMGAFIAMRASRDAQSAAARDASVAGAQNRRRLLQGLVVGELALSVAVLVAAGTMIQHLERLADAPLGFERQRLLSTVLTFPESPYSTAEQREQLYASLRRNVSESQAIEGAALTSMNPLTGGSFGAPIVSESQEPGSAALMVNHRLITPGLFQAMDIPILRGRDFGEDDRAGAPAVAIVSARVAEQLWPGQDAIGKRVRLARPNQPWLTVIGVVGNVKDNGELRHTWYLPYAQNALTPAARLVHLMVRPRDSAEAAVAALRAGVKRTDRNIAIGEVLPMDEVFRGTLVQDRTGALLSSVLAIFGLILAAAGVYGLLAFAVGQRVREIGVRIALGATPQQVVGLILGTGGKVVLIGIATGCLFGMAITRAISANVAGIVARPVPVFVIGGLVVAAAGLLATYLPARRAARIDPIAALRSE